MKSILGIIFLLSSLTLSVSGETTPKNRHTPVNMVNIDVTTHLGDNQVFLEGDRISFFISLDQSAYIYAFYQDANQNMYQLIPSKILSEHFFKQGAYIPFPPENSGLQFQASAPFGKEHILVYASDNKHINFQSINIESKIPQIALNQDQLHSHIYKLSKKLFGKTLLVIHTKKAKALLQ